MTVLVVLAAWLGVSWVHAEDSPSARAALERFTTGLESLQAGFEQIVINPEGVVETSGTGEVWLMKPDRFRWSYEGDFPEVIVADGRNVWMHDVVMEQVTVRPQSSLAQDSPLSVLMDISTLDEQFTVRELGNHDGVNLLELVSSSPESEFERVMLGLRDQSLALMVMEDAFGLRTELRFGEVLRNPDLRDDLFLFEPPAGTDVIGELPAGE